MGADGSLLELDPLQFELGYINAWVGHVGFEFLKPLPAKLVSSIPGAASVFGKIIVALQSDVMAQIPGVRELLLKIEEAVGGALGKPLLAVVRVDGNKGSYDGGADVSVSVSLFDPFRLSPAWTASAAGKKVLS